MEGLSTHSRGWTWVWIVSVWIGLGLIDATQTVFSMRAQGMHHAWVRLFFTLTLAWLPWAAATPLVRNLGREYPPFKWRPFSVWPAHLAACVGIGLVASGWLAGMEMLLNPWASFPPPGPFLTHWRNTFESGIVSDLVLYTAILAISYVRMAAAAH